MNSKRIATVSNGYTVTKMSIAVVVNQQRLAAILGADATPEKIAERVAEIQKLVSSATGYSETRGDIISVSAVEFIDGLDGEAIDEPGILASVGQHAGTMINAAAFIVVVFLVAFFGLKPMVAALGKPAAPALAGPSFDEVQRSLPGPDAAGGGAGAQPAASIAGARDQSIEIGSDGTMYAQYENGSFRELYRIPLANVQSPDMLTALPGNASVTSRPERVPAMTALFAFSRSASRLFSSPTAVEISWSATERKDWIALVPSFSVRTTSRAASSVVSARFRFEGAAE